MTGLQAKHMLSLGATAVQLGTAFVQCQTSNASAEYRKALFNEPVTQISASLSGRPLAVYSTIGTTKLIHLLDLPNQSIHTLTIWRSNLMLLRVNTMTMVLVHFGQEVMLHRYAN